MTLYMQRKLADPPVCTYPGCTAPPGDTNQCEPHRQALNARVRAHSRRARAQLWLFQRERTARGRRAA